MRRPAAVADLGGMVHAAFSTGAVAAFFQVVMIDLTLAGDNAVAVGVAAAGLPRSIRRRAMVLGLGAAVAMLIGFALIAVQLLKVVGLLLAGGAILLWVCWRTWRDLRSKDVAVDVDEKGENTGRRPKTLLVALFEILAADLSMSLDNVLGVAGAARAHPQVLVFGLILSITVTGVAAGWIAKLLRRAPWLRYLGLAIVLFVALSMMWQGAVDVIKHT
jgi:YjbE family integral membrane protein